MNQFVVHWTSPKKWLMLRCGGAGLIHDDNIPFLHTPKQYPRPLLQQILIDMLAAQGIDATLPAVFFRLQAIHGLFQIAERLGQSLTRFNPAIAVMRMIDEIGRQAARQHIEAEP